MTAQAAATRTPVFTSSLKVRQPEFEFNEDIPRYWWDNNPVKTLLLAAMSSGFPPGERFFIETVRHFQDQITDPELKQTIRSFIGQEAHHSKEHKLLNQFLEKRGIHLARFEEELEKFLNFMRQNYSPERQLAHTVAVEHFTALLCEGVLMNYDTLEAMDPRMAALWAWHAVEESEHKAVAFDVFRSVGGSEFVRLTEMMTVSVLFPLATTLHLVQLLNDDGQLGNITAWRKSLSFLFGKPGALRKLIPNYLHFYSPTFHPNNHDVSERVNKSKKKWLGSWA